MVAVAGSKFCYSDIIISLSSSFFDDVFAPRRVDLAFLYGFK